MKVYNGDTVFYKNSNSGQVEEVVNPTFTIHFEGGENLSVDGCKRGDDIFDST